MADEAIHETVVNPPVTPVPAGNLNDIIRRISWGAVWAGVMAALGMEILFTLFGSFIGFGMYNWQAANPWAGISAWTTVWYFVTAGWSMFFGAWCAARLSGNPVVGDGIWHGIATWGLATLATILIVGVTSFAILREGISVMTTAALVAPHVAAGAAAQVPPAVGQLQANSGPVSQATANIISGLSLRIFGGVVLGFITAILGGWVGRSRTLVVAPQGVVPLPTRRAA